MGTNQIYLFVLLLASLSASCTSDCLNLEPYSERPFRKCAKLYIMLEKALLANPENLYQLQTCFFPSYGSEPTYVQVTFALNKRFYYTCWTSSVLLKSVDPSVLSVLQLELLNLLLATEDISSGPPFFSDAGLFFNLTVNSTVHDNPHYQIIPILQELTSWVSIFECSLVPRRGGGGEGAPSIHCLRMRLIAPEFWGNCVRTYTYVYWRRHKLASLIWQLVFCSSEFHIALF